MNNDQLAKEFGIIFKNYLDNHFRHLKKVAKFKPMNDNTGVVYIPIKKENKWILERAESTQTKN